MEAKNTLHGADNRLVHNNKPENEQRKSKKYLKGRGAPVDDTHQTLIIKILTRDRGREIEGIFAPIIIGSNWCWFL